MPEHRQLALVSRIIDECRYAPGSDTAKRIARETLPLPRDFCATCDKIRKEGGFGPSHDGSKHCESGSIASGGQNAHCACEVCF